MKRRTGTYLTGALAAVLVAVAVALAAVPQTITYQGILTHTGGTPVNGTVQMQFSLYSSATATVPLWSESHQNVQVTQGRYSVVLGNGSPTPVLIDLPFDVPYYLGVKVGSDAEMTPRLPLTSTGYAMRAAAADSVVSSGTATITGGTNGNVVIAPGGTGTVDVSNARITNAANPTAATDVATKQYVDSKTMSLQVVTDTSVQAWSNIAYLANSASQVTITLPASPAIGDIVRVVGIGEGGWRIAQNANQCIVTTNLPEKFDVHWRPSESFRDWNSVASSSDGRKLVAVVSGGQIYTSTDSGVTWTAHESARIWNSVASSSDGTKLVAVAGGLPKVSIGDQIYISTDSGVTWTPRESVRNWTSVASSSDGTNLVAVGDGQIYISTDSGVTWTPRESARYWSSVVSSSDGTKLVAVERGGQIYTSENSGVTWTAHESARNWWSVASSSDGTRLVAVVYGGRIYTSENSGETWTARDSTRDWRSVASSSDGTKLVAVVFGGLIYTGQLYLSETYTTVGTNGSISGGQFEAIELMYLGNMSIFGEQVGRFMILSHEGRLVVM